MSSSHRHDEGGAPPRSVFQYLEILRDRWISALIAFLVVAGLVAAHALFSTPSYESHAVIQLDTTGPGNDPLAEVGVHNAKANVEAELEVMGSYSVAKQAARLAGAGVVIREENGYRPWESFLRTRTGGGHPTRLRAEVLGRSMPQRTGTFRLVFDKSGASFELTRADEEQGMDTAPFHAQTGTEVEVGGDRIRIHLEHGETAGRRFVLALKSEERASRWVQGMVKAREVGSYTGIVELGAVTDDPYLAQRIATSLAESYIAHKEARKKGQLQRRIDWLKAQLKKKGKALKGALDARDAHITDRGAVLLGQKATAAFEAQRKLFEQRVEQQQILAEQQAALVALGTSATPEQVMAAIGATNVDPQTRAVADSLVRLELQRGALLRQNSTVDDPAVRDLDAEIAEARGMLDKRLESQRAEVKAQINRRIDAINKRLGQIQDEVAKHDAVLDGLPAEERALAELTRNVEAAQAGYSFLERVKGESELALTSQLTQAHQIDDALLNTARQSPVLFRRGLMAVFLGLFAAFGVALVRHLRDRTVRSPRDLEEGLGLQLYATIPLFTSVPRRQRKGLKSSLVVRDVPNSTLTENYRTLRANIRFADAGTPIQALAITSALPKEGKTITTLNLGAAMARAGNSVLVIDADLRRPMVDVHLGGQRQPGTVEILLDELPWASTVQTSDVENLSFIPAGRTLKDPSALLEGGRFQELLAALRKEYEYILFDVPPVLAVADAAAFFRSLDAVFIISRQGVCPVDVVAGAQDQVQRFGGNLVGGIFNGFDAKRAGSRKYGYGGYYGYHSYYANHAYHDDGNDSRRKKGGGGNEAPESEDAEATRKV